MTQPHRIADLTLQQLAGRQLAEARRAHDRLRAADDPLTLCRLSQAYVNAADALRRTLARMAGADWDPVTGGLDGLLIDDLEAEDALVDQRVEVLQDAVARVAAAAWSGAPMRQADALNALDACLDEWRDDPDFLVSDLDGQVADACRRLSLPAELAAGWRNLPQPPLTFDPATVSELIAAAFLAP